MGRRQRCRLTYVADNSATSIPWLSERAALTCQLHLRHLVDERGEVVFGHVAARLSQSPENAVADSLGPEFLFLGDGLTIEIVYD